jgi:hypothetical protein
MKLRARVDNNHKEIVECFRKLGCSVLSLAAVGKGCPDLLISYQQQLYLVEVKDTGGKLNAMQEAWHRKWDSRVFVVKSTMECVSLINKLRRQ